MRTSNVQRRTLNVEAKKVSDITSLRRSTFAFSFLLIAIQGCCQPKPVARPPYYGKTDPMNTVVADINRNGGKIPSLWTRLNFTATLVDPEKHTTNAVSGDGTLMYARPISLLLDGNKDIAGPVFQLGSNNDEYWVKIRSSANTFNYYFGTYANLGKPGSASIPIRPDLILEVLGISLYNTNFLQEPVPVMRFDNDADAYIFDQNIRLADRWETREEIWYDRASRLPIKVILYGANGRAVLKADLSKHTPVETPGVPADQWPKIASHYDLIFPDSATEITFDFLNTPELQHKARSIMLPNAGSFRRPDPDDGDKMIPIDPQ